MPTLTKSLLTPDGHKARAYLSWPGEAVVFSRDVNMASVTYPCIALTYDGTGTGVTGDIEPDMEVRIVRAGALVGRLRIRGSGHTGTVLQVAEFSRGEVDIQDNDRIEVVRSWRIRPRLPAPDATFAPDRATYTDQHADPGPVSNSGGPWAGWKADAAAIPWKGDTSFVVDPDSGGSVTHAWSFPGAAVTSSTAANPTSDYSAAAAGTYWIRHNTTDASNSKTTSQWAWVRTHDANDPPLDVVEATISLSEDGPGTLTCTVAGGTATLAALPDGHPICIWVDEDYGPTRASYGSATPGRGQMKFVGYLLRDSVQWDPDAHTVTFEAADAVYVLDNLPGFGTLITSKGSPANWLEAKQLTTQRAILYRLREASTVLNVCDLLVDGVSYGYPELFIQQATPLGQVRELAAGASQRFVSTRGGMLRLYRSVVLKDSSARASAPIMLTLEGDDLLQLTARREHRYGTNQLEGRGFTNNAAAPVFSRAPGLAPSEAPAQATVERLIVGDQAELNALTGRQYALQNRLRNGRPAAEVTVSLRGGYDAADPAYGDEWIRLNGLTTRRGTVFANTRFTLARATVTYRDGTADVEWTLNEETDGPPGVTYFPPPDDSAFVDFPPYDFLPGIDSGDLLPIPDLPPNTNVMPVQAWALSYETSGGYTPIARAVGMDITTGTVLWNQFVHSTITGRGAWGCSDPARYVDKYTLTEDGLWKIPNWGTPTLVATNLAMFGESTFRGSYMEMSINRRGYIAVICARWLFAYTFDYGATWQRTYIPGGGATGEESAFPSNTSSGCFMIAERRAGHIFATLGGGDPTPTQLWMSTNWGATWTLISSDVSGGNRFQNYPVYVPYTRSDGSPNRVGAGTAGTEIFTAGGAGGAGAFSELRRIVLNNTTVVSNALVSPQPLNGTFGLHRTGGQTRRLLHMPTGGGNKIAVVLSPAAIAANTQVATATITSGVPGTWNYATIPVLTNRGQNLGGYSTWSTDALIVWGQESGWPPNAGGIAMSYDGGATFFDATPGAAIGWTNGRTAYAEFDLSAVQ